jgi:5-methylcytosine-specific restriction enzyme A
VLVGVDGGFTRDVGSALTSRGSTRRWRKLRAAVLARDRGICHLCGHAGARTVDHLVPRAHGGDDGMANLAAAHGRCNEERGARVAGQPVTSRRW